MSAWLVSPWTWAALGLALLVAEALVPGYLFLGFGAGALLTGLALGLAPGLAAASPLALLGLFAALSLACWLALWRLVGRRPRRGRARDVNDFISKG